MSPPTNSWRKRRTEHRFGAKMVLCVPLTLYFCKVCHGIFIYFSNVFHTTHSKEVSAGYAGRIRSMDVKEWLIYWDWCTSLFRKRQTAEIRNVQTLCYEYNISVEWVIVGFITSNEQKFHVYIHNENNFNNIQNLCRNEKLMEQAA